MTVSYWQDASTDQTLECDTCVVGAGIVGLYLARMLARQGQRVCVLEARHVAAGASGRNAGMVLTGTAYYYHDAIRSYGHDLAREIWRFSLHNREVRAFAYVLRPHSSMTNEIFALILYWTILLFSTMPWNSWM